MQILYTQKTDNELLTMFREGDEEAFNEITNRYKRLVKVIATEFFLVGGDREDLLQEGMIGLFDAVVSFREDKNAEFSTFAGVCIRRKIIKAVVADQRKKNIPLNSSMPIEDSSFNGEQAVQRTGTYIDQMNKVPSPEEIYMGKEEKKLLLEKIAGVLSEMEKETLEFFLQGMDYNEIARKMGKNPKSIDNCINRILTKASQLELTNENQ